MVLEVTESIQIPEAEWSWTYARSGGPGGQNVNKVASKAVLRWAMLSSPSVPEPVKNRLRAAHPSHCTIEGDYLVVSQKYRDQERNREDCLNKLAEMIRKAAKPPTPRRATKPTKSSQRRRLTDKKLNSERKSQRRPSTDE
jgi:ribosome-associated protein